MANATKTKAICTMKVPNIIDSKSLHHTSNWKSHINNILHVVMFSRVQFAFLQSQRSRSTNLPWDFSTFSYIYQCLFVDWRV